MPRRTAKGVVLDRVTFVARRFAGNIEAAYRSMWQRWCS
jgi:hypothetical protein